MQIFWYRREARHQQTRIRFFFFHFFKKSWEKVGSNRRIQTCQHHDPSLLVAEVQGPANWIDFRVRIHNFLKGNKMPPEDATKINSQNYSLGIIAKRLYFWARVVLTDDHDDDSSRGAITTSEIKRGVKHGPWFFPFSNNHHHLNRTRIIIFRM